MKQFDYVPTRSVDEACSVLSGAGAGARILAGGTDLLIELRKPNQKKMGPIVDISFIDTLRSIDTSDGAVTIGPLVTHAEVAESKIVCKFAPLLSNASSAIGSPQIRNRGTIGGNIMNAAACADTVPPLIALGATITLQSSGGSRSIGIADLFIKPYRTNAKPDEMLTGISFRKLQPDAKSSFIKLGRRNALSISRLSVAAVLSYDKNGMITDARIVPGAALPVWRRIYEAEKTLIGRKPSPELFAAAGKKVSGVMISSAGRRWSTEYKEPVLAALVRRALEECR